MSWEAIARRFREAEVPLRRSERPWFRVDVERQGRRNRREWITLAPADASVQVLDVSRGHRQVLLLVREDLAGGKPRVQKILCGRDEQFLFAVVVPNPLGVAVNSVAAAHAALKPREVREAERDRRTRWGIRKAVKVLRQGDWFFEPYPHLTQDLAGRRKRARLGGGNPHVVDYLVGNPNHLSGENWFPLRPTGPVLARGFVRHREHRPLHLRCWHRVYHNTASWSPGNYQD